MKLLALLGVAIAVLTAGCGGAAEAESSDLPPADVLTHYVAAVRGGDGPAVLELLSERSIDRFDLTAEKVETSYIPAVRTDLRTLGRSPAPAFERLLGEDLAVAALEDRANRLLPGPRTVAEPIVREGDRWKVDPFGLDMVYGYPDDLSADPRRPVLTFGVNTTGVPEARLWIDGRELPLKRRPGSGSPVMFEARPRTALARGRHLVVAFAQVGDRVGALAWVSSV